MSRIFHETIIKELWSVRWAPRLRAKIKESIHALKRERQNRQLLLLRRP